MAATDPAPSGTAWTPAPSTVRRRPRALRNLAAKLASLPMILIALVVFLGCSAWTVLHSFTKSGLLPKGPVGIEWWNGLPYPVIEWGNLAGLSQYERLWSTPKWYVAIENLAVFGVLSMVFTLGVGFFLACLLDRKVRGEDVFRTIFLYPFALSFVVTGLVWQWILNPELGLQAVVRGWGWEGFAFDPLYDREIVIYGLLIAGLWQGTGLVMCILLAGLRGVDEDIWKAARVDGIPTWKTYLVVVVPMLRPVFVTALVLIAAGIVKVYDLVIAQTGGGPGGSSEVPAKYVMDAMFAAQNLGQGFAASSMMLLSVIVILIPWAYLEFGGKRRG